MASAPSSASCPSPRSSRSSSGPSGSSSSATATGPPRAPSPTIPRQAIRVQIGATPDSRPVAPGFVGLSIEYRSAPGYFGTPADPDGVFEQLVRNLTPGQSPVLRFGGDTTDWTWAPTPGVPKPPGIRYTLTPAWMRSTAAAARALDARLILGINFESDSPAIAAAESAALLSGVGRRYVAGLELGNEPEVYGSLGWYETPAGVAVPGRPASYDFASYLRDYARVSRALPRDVPLVGSGLGSAAVAGGPEPVPGRQPAGRGWSPSIAIPCTAASRHVTRPSSRRSPTSWRRWPPAVRPPASPPPSPPPTRAASRCVPMSSTASRAVGRAGSATPSRPRSGSSTPSSTWPGPGSTASTSTPSTRRSTSRSRSPSAPGAGVPRSSRCTTACSCSPRPRRPGPGCCPPPIARRPTLRIWATRARDGRVRVVLINDSRRRPATVAVRLPGGVRPAAPAAAAVRLRAPHADARAGVTIGGQSFGTSTSTGQPRRSDPVIHPAAGPGQLGHTPASGDRHARHRGPDFIRGLLIGSRLTARHARRYVDFANDCSTPVRPFLNGTAHESGG